MQKLIVLLGLAAVANGLKFTSGPDVAAEVAAEAQENIEIHEGFASQEAVSDKVVKEVKADKSMTALVQQGQGRWMVALDKDMKTEVLLQAGSPVDACGAITCGALSCPAGFTATEVAGHCCPYCVNPDIKVESAVTGATGSHGGKASTFCPEVFCFPTMCAKAISNPTAANGQCCAECK